MLRSLILQVDLDALCTDIAWSTQVEVTSGTSLWAYRSKQQKHAWGTADWAKCTAEAQDAISTAIAADLDIHTGCGTYLACIHAFQQGFAKDTPMRLSRFQTLQNQVFENLLPELVKQSLVAADPTIERMKQRTFDDMYYDDTRESFVKLSKGIQGCLTDQVYRRLYKPLQLASDFVLEEAPEVHARREELHQQLHRLQVAQQKIGNIHETVCTETTLQKDLLGLPASSETSVSSPSVSSPICPVASTAPLIDQGTRRDQAVEQPHSGGLRPVVDRMKEDWSSLSSASSTELPEALFDVEAHSALGTQTAQEKKTKSLSPLPMMGIHDSQSQMLNRNSETAQVSHSIVFK